MKELKIKVCGLKDPYNIAEVAVLQPDYMGFILYPGSPRYVSLETAGKLVKYIPSSIQRVAVLVNEPFENAMKIAHSGFFDLIQLHGNETIDYCSKLSININIIKAFSVAQTLPPGLSGYLDFCKMFLFDTAGEKYGGNGKSFDHKILLHYSLDKEFILSGGISSANSTQIKSLKANKLIAVDLNSRFESKPGIKDVKLLKCFIEKIRKYDTSN
ncbi:MAG: phosphoribosylanthranilate isomerase [Bacteroidia bacterium]|nr:phosphoribosylanthranilate isomerase [Bacteroidia bacterium]